MKKELEYFRINNAYGGNQEWFRDPMMHLGGCAAATACDVSILMALYHNRPELYPFEAKELNKRDYVSFAMKMKPYLRPRMQGVNTLDIFMDGYGQYLMDRGERKITMKGFDGVNTVESAKNLVREQIDKGMPMPCLILYHKDKKLKDFMWHWFPLIGYDEAEDRMMVKTATYGEEYWLDMDELWDTGYSQKGGLVIIDDKE